MLKKLGAVLTVMVAALLFAAVPASADVVASSGGFSWWQVPSGGFSWWNVETLSGGFSWWNIESISGALRFW